MSDLLQKTLVMRSFFNGLVMALITLLMTVGYLVAPILFANLSSVVAGDLAGKLFAVSAVIVMLTLSVMIAWLYWMGFHLKLTWPLWLSNVVMLALYGWISPAMQAIKAQYPTGLSTHSAAWPEFAAWHGVYQVLYLVVIVLLLYWWIKNLLKPL
jgi:hypothetical protein